jgi:hypothetical protein
MGAVFSKKGAAFAFAHVVLDCGVCCFGSIFYFAQPAHDRFWH